ncbi:agmatine deiminase [Selenomonas sp. ND2010]|uniref:agmatine deiminase n=1 Tax=Selenomonas sp. ND2010 TaxID=1410618 RepID=UPI00051C8164|nr:agmatine deiminase [Selenomonas sp. ND2010]
MVRKNTAPTADGFYMPAEFAPHHGTFLIWPVRPGSWTNGGRDVQPVFVRLIEEIAAVEELYLLVGDAHRAQAEAMLAHLPQEHIHYLAIPTDDAWARDMGPTYVVDGKTRRGISWRFNAWGGEVDGLYPDYASDNAAAPLMAAALGDDCYEAGDFVLEGGSIHVDGEGTAVVTEACLLSAGRNPQLAKEQIEQKLKDYLGVTKVIWLPRGIYNDETNEHVDNVFAFVRPGEAVLAWTDDEKDPQYALSQADLAVLEGETDAKERRLVIHKVPIPEQPVCITAEEANSFAFADGEDMREPGERLAASYVNFYICNGKVIVPQFGDAMDATALQILGKCFPDRKVVGLPARAVIVGGGNFHCLTQQIPAVGI